MSTRIEDKAAKNPRRKIAPIVLLSLAVILLITSVIGYLLRGTESSKANLDKMRTYAVLHTSSEGLVDSIAQQARADKLKELRADKDFRKRGLDEVNSICDAAMQEAREAAEKLYSNPVISDEAALESTIDNFQGLLATSGTLREKEQSSYAQLYLDLVDNISDWTAIAGSDQDDAAVFTALSSVASGLTDADNAQMKDSFVKLARDMAAKQQEKADAEQQEQLISMMTGAVSDWSEYIGLDNDLLWDKLAEVLPELSENERFKGALLESAAVYISAAESGESVPEAQAADKGADTVSETQVDYSYFIPSSELAKEIEEEADAFTALNEQLVSIIPDLGSLSGKLQNTLRTNIEKVVWPGSLDFSARYNAYASQNAVSVLDSGSARTLKLASAAESILLLSIALLLLGLTLLFWPSLTKRFGVPRTIITLFFIYLCLLAEQFSISLPMMLGNVLERMTMYGVLVLAMMPGIQCGIGLNMGMTIGCISGLLGIVLSLQFNMTGFAALLFACASGAVVSLPLGWAYSKLLNRMKGNEMTISTYVGFSFVSLMCIGWMMLPFNNPKIIWLLSGHGLRVTHSLLGSFAHLLDNLFSFKIFGVEVPTGGLLFLLLCCFLMWLFSRSKVGIAMTAAGTNPRFAEASGINVNHMRTVGTVLSTMIAAVGIVIYSQAFGYAQLYTAPRQLGFIASSAILIGGASVRKAKVSNVLIGVFLFEGVLVFGQQIANSVLAGGGLSEVMRIMISNGIILYALTQSGGASRE
jgi:simple sugar transport system permease protein